MRASLLHRSIATAIAIAMLMAASLGCSGSNTAGAGYVDAGAGEGGQLFGSIDSGPLPRPGGCVPNPANYDFPDNQCDDDGDGTVDNPPGPCDANLSLTGDAPSFAKAIGICQNASPTAWGLVSSAYTNTHSGATAPNDAQHGILSAFGDVVKPREGAALGALSSGFARDFDDPAGATAPFKGIKTPMQASANGGGSLPAGFPKSAAGCPSQANASTHDLIDVKLVIKAPANANGIQFDFDFWSGEWPEYVCSDFNDAFVAYLTSKGVGANISLDSEMNPVSVNNGFFDHCTPNTTTGCLAATGLTKTAACPSGPSELRSTGFDDQGTYCGGAVSSGGGATGWLTSKAPIAPGETITLELIIWDVGDANFDSSVLLDHFQWIEGTTDTATGRPPN